MLTEPYEKALTPANVKKELDFHESELTFRVSAKVKGKAKTIEFTVKPDDDLRTIVRDALSEIDETVSAEWTHRHYVKDDEFSPKVTSLCQPRPTAWEIGQHACTKPQRGGTKFTR